MNPVVGSLKGVVPTSINPIYSMNSVNQAVVLYDGNAELEQGTKKKLGKCLARFEWLPRPGLRFVLDLNETDRNLDWLILGDGMLHMEGLNWHAKVSITGQSGSNDGVHEIRGIITDFEYGKDQKVKSIIFHVVNFNDVSGELICSDDGFRAWSGRFVTEVGEWIITLDKVENHKTIYDELEEIGGYAITHAGKLELKDGTKFDPKKSEIMFDCIFRFLSFCRGAWVAPILVVGFDENHERTWEKWRGWKIQRWISVRSWFISYWGEGLSAGFSEFYRLWNTDQWNEALRFSNHWYVESNMSSGGVEGSIILAQAAFELLGWTHLVEEMSALSEKGYENLDAKDKLRLLLSICKIPADIPSNLVSLSAAAQVNQWKDGPQAITEIRNALVHSNPAKRKRLFGENVELVHESWSLSIWYLELIILKSLNYNGRFMSRISPGQYDIERFQKTPWS